MVNAAVGHLLFVVPETLKIIHSMVFKLPLTLLATGGFVANTPLGQDGCGHWGGFKSLISNRESINASLLYPEEPSQALALFSLVFVDTKAALSAQT